MLLEITCGAERTEVDLVDGTFRLGGAKGDEVRLAGLPHSMLALRISSGRVTVTSKLSIAIGAAQFPAHVPRLLVPGETMQLPRNVTLRQVPEKDAQSRRLQKGTACVLKDLVGDGVTPGDTRAATLTCLTGVDTGRVYPLGLAELLIGRADDVPVRVRDIAVSRRHARMVQRSVGFAIEGLRGTNGVFVNGQRIARQTALKSGDVIEIGQTLLRYDGPPVEQPVASLHLVPQLPAVIVEPEVANTEPVVSRGSRWEMFAITAGATLAVLGLVATASIW